MVGSTINQNTYRFAEGPLLQQILVHMDAMIPITTKIRVVTRKPMAIRFWRRPLNFESNQSRENLEISCGFTNPYFPRQQKKPIEFTNPDPKYYKIENKLSRETHQYESIDKVNANCCHDLLEKKKKSNINKRKKITKSGERQEHQGQRETNK